MSQSLSNVLVHVVFSTKDRHPYIQNDIESKLYRYINGICHQLECPLYQIGGMSDHLHLLFALEGVHKLIMDYTLDYFSLRACGQHPAIF